MASLENKYRITQIGLVLSCQICTFKGLPVMSGAFGPCCMFHFYALLLFRESSVDQREHTQQKHIIKPKLKPGLADQLE